MQFSADDLFLIDLLMNELSLSYAKSLKYTNIQRLTYILILTFSLYLLTNLPTNLLTNYLITYILTVEITYNNIINLYHSSNNNQLSGLPIFSIVFIFWSNPLFEHNIT